MDNKLIGVIMGVVVGIIVLGALLAPTITDIQKTAGNDVTLNNSIKSDSPKYNIWDGSDIILAYDGTDYTVNNVAQSFAASTQRIIIASNDFAARNGGTTDSPQLQSQYVTLTEQVVNKIFTFEVVDKEYTLTLNGVTYTGDVDWLVYAVDDGTANLGQIPQGISFYTSDYTDIIVLGNIYVTGENDTFYSYYKGDLTVNDTYADVSSVTISKELADGYTDVYETTVTVNIGDESFTPYYILTPITVTGHEAAGAAYSLLGAIIIVMAIAIVIFAARSIFYKD